VISETFNRTHNLALGIVKYITLTFIFKAMLF